MSNAGKGDDPRPFSISRKEFEKKFDRIDWSDTTDKEIEKIQEIMDEVNEKYGNALKELANAEDD